MRSWFSGFRRRRLIIACFSLVSLYLFVKYLPTDVPTVASRIDTRTGRSFGRPNQLHNDQRSSVTGQQLPAKHPNEDTLSQQRQQQQTSYDGPTKFYNLASSLRPHLHHGKLDKPRVVFALFNLKSAPTLMPFACEMAAYNRSEVHIAVMAARDDSIAEIKTVSGLDESECNVVWHDTRPDFNLHSSRRRRKEIAHAQIGHMHAALKSSLWITDTQHAAEAAWVAAVQEKLDAIAVPLLFLPDDPLQSVNWAASLDAKSLAVLNDIQVDVLITPYAHSSGSLIRLLESLRSANYAGLSLPRFIIELPPSVDPAALRYLENLRWPAGRDPSESRLVLRRRVDSQLLSPSASSVRTIESFYPPSWPQSHVLVLSPDVEVAADYMQYLIYTMLQYKYGDSGALFTGNLMGITLEAADQQSTGDASPLFMKQTTTSKAALYFGDKWVELHKWTSHRLAHDKDLKRVMDEHEPVPPIATWMREVNYLMQAQNLFMIYPGFSISPDTRLVQIHSASSHSSEDLHIKLPSKSTEDLSELADIIEHDDVLGSSSPAVLGNKEPTFHDHLPLVSLLGGQVGDGSRIAPSKDLDIPLYASQMERISWSHAQQNAIEFADRFSLTLGDCKSLDQRDDAKKPGVEYLFCGQIK